MTAHQLKELEKRLWEAADQLRANSKLTATEYSFPVLGLLFLRHAFRRFNDARVMIEEKLPVHPQRGRRAVTKDDFQQAKAIYLQEKARWDYLATLPEGKDIGEEINEAMRLIESDYEALSGVLPKDYQTFEKDLLQRLIRIFNDESLDRMPGDVFGRIYEYFLNEFAKSGAQEGGEFFTPPSLVNTIVAIIEPNHGIVLDPACGSAGMFVQTGHFIEEEGENPATKVSFYGQEKADTNTRLAKMNMAIHGLEGSILQGNTFYEDHHNMAGRCDFVMANPPFNVDGVDKAKESVKNDRRLPFGLPKTDNANYLWIQYFYAYLNPAGRAGFVMASSASDAGHTERDIRAQLVKTGAVDVMVSIGTKFFYTRSLPCTLWFFDRAKEADPERSDKTLMLDLRDVYRKVSSSIHDFTPEQLRNIKAIVGLYRGDHGPFHATLDSYQNEVAQSLADAGRFWQELLQNKAAKAENLALEVAEEPIKTAELKRLKKLLSHAHKELAAEAKNRLQSDELKKDKVRRERLQNYLAETERRVQAFQEAADHALYFEKEWTWLNDRFPEGAYRDVPGLCRVVTQAEIAANDYSLTAGRYVGVAAQMDDGFDFEERMAEIKMELADLDREAAVLAGTIQEHLTALGL
ncbi:MAG: N-6 DNA methylase [Saprospiraceae bacterium]|nr:N-6 DNA methylase [Saprospiraceae bacterium]